MLNQLKMWLVQRQRLDQIGPMSHMGPGMKNWLVQYLRLDQIGPMSYMGPGPISDIGPGPMWHMGLAYYWQVRFLEVSISQLKITQCFLLCHSPLDQESPRMPTYLKYEYHLSPLPL